MTFPAKDPMTDLRETTPADVVEKIDYLLEKVRPLLNPLQQDKDRILAEIARLQEQLAQTSRLLFCVEGRIIDMENVRALVLKIDALNPKPTPTNE